jgi:hypothetical protein
VEGVVAGAAAAAAAESALRADGFLVGPSTVAVLDAATARVPPPAKTARGPRLDAWHRHRASVKRARWRAALPSGAATWHSENCRFAWKAQVSEAARRVGWRREMRYSVVPAPVRFDADDGDFALRPGTRVVYSDPGVAPTVEQRRRAASGSRPCRAECLLQESRVLETSPSAARVSQTPRRGPTRLSAFARCSPHTRLRRQE